MRRYSPNFTDNHLQRLPDSSAAVVNNTMMVHHSTLAGQSKSSWRASDPPTVNYGGTSPRSIKINPKPDGFGYTGDSREQRAKRKPVESSPMTPMAGVGGCLETVSK